MKLFPCGHATHPQWRMAAALALAQLRAQMSLPDYADAPTLALLYITDHYAAQASEILEFLSAELPEVTDWAGTVGVGLAVNNAEYFDEPALAVLLCDVPPDQYRVFSGVAPLGLGFEAQAALVHADAATPDVPDLIAELAQRTASGYLFGGLASGRVAPVQFAVGGNGNIAGHGGASGVFSGGLSGVAFGPEVHLVSRVTQGCQPVGPQRTVTAVDGHVILELNGKPALPALLADLNISLDPAPPVRTQAMAALRQTLAGLSPASGAAMGRAGHFGAEVIVRHLMGVDPVRQAVVLAGQPEVGMSLAFCQRNVAAARADLVRVCAEIREELEPQEITAPMAGAWASTHAQALPSPSPGARMGGAVYVSCAGRGGPHFGGPSAELRIVRKALGDVPLVGFFAGGEIAHDRLHGYTGVLTVFAQAQ